MGNNTEEVLWFFLSQLASLLSFLYIHIGLNFHENHCRTAVAGHGDGGVYGGRLGLYGNSAFLILHQNLTGEDKPVFWPFIVTLIFLIIVWPLSFLFLQSYFNLELKEKHLELKGILIMSSIFDLNSLSLNLTRKPMIYFNQNHRRLKYKFPNHKA